MQAIGVGEQERDLGHIGRRRDLGRVAVDGDEQGLLELERRLVQIVNLAGRALPGEHALDGVVELATG